jgi:hypothetical protein
MLQTDPDASGNSSVLRFTLSDNTLATVDGDALKLSQGNIFSQGKENTFVITVDGDKMTWVMTGAVTGADKRFTFTREATPR